MESIYTTNRWQRTVLEVEVKVKVEVEFEVEVEVEVEVVVKEIMWVCHTSSEDSSGWM
jgi:hypothetical protein